MSASRRFVSPIAIDLGAKNTGVYFAHYPEGSTLEVFKQDGTKTGKVYQLNKNSYTLLMAKRTAARHQRRGYDRRQMAKRLFKLIWCEHFGLEWDKDIQQTIGFLFNRRGFSFLAGEYDEERLTKFPQDAFKELPQDLRNSINGYKNSDDSYNFMNAIQDWLINGKISSNYLSIKKQLEKAKGELFVFRGTRELLKYCKDRKNDKKVEEGGRPRLRKLPKRVLEEWSRLGVKGLEDIDIQGEKANIVEFLNQAASSQVQIIFESIPDTGEKEKKCKKWNFNAEKFEQEKEDFGTTDKPNVKTHLHHLAFAMHTTLAETKFGNRYRSKYFEEISSELNSRKHTHAYLKNFCYKLHTNEFSCLNVEKLTRLIGHVNNLELKPLRKYFNDKRHRKGDIWDEERIARLFERWILREWRVGKKDSLKAAGRGQDYNELRSEWSNYTNKHRGTVVNFWSENKPEYTIPPYQDSNNRRPPKCQSLVFNVNYLNEHYPQWQKWLNKLCEISNVKEYLDDYEDELRNLESGKEKPYFSDVKTGSKKKDSGRRNTEELKARVLQFVLDRTNASDRLNLNEVYSHVKKLNQQYRDNEATEDTEEKLKKSINKSKKNGLPKSLQTEPNYKSGSSGQVALFPRDSFFHFICRYYKLRRRARDGRLFVFPEYRKSIKRGYENTGRFNSEGHLLTYCNHKPRQKRYQLWNDVAGLFQIPPEELKEKAGDEAEIDQWLKKIEGLERACEKAAKEQRNRRGRMKQDIRMVYDKIDLCKKETGIDARLYSLCKTAKKKYLEIAKQLYDERRLESWEKELENNPATAVYLLAQLNNIVFKDRQGNAKTCAICSLDNAKRMEMQITKNGTKTSHAKAQRLPAIETRMFDGAVMRIARIVGSAIANDKWERIRSELRKGNKVCVPIITESNQFEFEPSKEEIVKDQRLKRRKGKALERGGDKNLPTKEKRIKDASHGICPYCDKELGNEGEIDHILPRAGRRAELNDEANLIYVHSSCNQQKGEDKYTLNELKLGYKKKVRSGPQKQDSVLSVFLQ